MEGIKRAPHALMSIWVLLFLLVAFAAADTDRPDRVMFSNFHSAHYPDELRRPNVRALIESRDTPMVWIGSDNGLISWDGNRAKVRLEQPVTALGIDGNNYNWLWVGTESSGLFRMYNDDKKPVPYLPGKGEDTLIDGHVRCIVEGTLSIESTDTGDRKSVGLWVATNHGLHKIERSSELQVEDFQIRRVEHTSTQRNQGRHWASRPDTGTILSLLPTKDALWMGTHGGKLKRRDLRTGKTTTEFEFGFPVTSLEWRPKEKKLAHTQSNSETEYDEDFTCLLAGTDGNGIFCANVKSRSQHQLTNSLESGRITSLAVDSQGTIWAGTRSGLARLNFGATEFQRYFSGNSGTALTGDEVECIYLSGRNERLWVGTTFGVSMLNTTHRWFTHIAPVSTMPDSLAGRMVSGFAEALHSESILVCSDRALEEIDLKTNKVIRRLYHDRIESLQINAALVDRNQTLWMATDQGLSWQTSDKSTLEPIYRTQLDDAINCFLEDSTGQVWIGTSNSGVAIHPTQSKATTATLQFLIQKTTASVSFLHEDLDSNIWIGTAGDGLWVVSRHTGEVTHHGGISGSTSAFDADYVNTIHHDSTGTLWIATADRGLFRCTQAGMRFERIDGFPPPPEEEKDESIRLPDDIRSAIVDDSDNLWIATSNEIMVHFSGTRRTQIFTASDGLQESFMEGSAFLSSRGELFFGGKMGFNVVDPSNLPERQTAVAVLTGLELFGEPVNHGPGNIIERPLNLVDRLELDFEQNQVGFNFSTPGFDSFGRTSYRYRMHNFDQDWRSPAKGRRDAQYNLEPGHYEFEVQAALDGRSWQGTGPLHIIVSPPWHQTVWAKAGTALAVILLLAGAM
ncbi:MAG: ligand-binding sensor domain-containing protein, partial [Verrucomicrobiales bacterium]